MVDGTVAQMRAAMENKGRVSAAAISPSQAQAPT
jgi:hypothetical protein